MRRNTSGNGAAISIGTPPAEQRAFGSAPRSGATPRYLPCPARRDEERRLRAVDRSALAWVAAPLEDEPNDLDIAPCDAAVNVAATCLPRRKKARERLVITFADRRLDRGGSRSRGRFINAAAGSESRRAA
jgi:hypothetical protein